MKCGTCGKTMKAKDHFCSHCGAENTQFATRKQNVKRRGNGQGSVYVRPDGKAAAVVTLGYYVDEHGVLKRKTKTKLFATKTEANNFLPSLAAMAEKPADLSIFDLHEIYIKTKEYTSLSSSQSKKLDYAWTHLKDIYNRGITTLSVDDLQTVIDRETNTYYPARDIKVLLSHLYRIAIRKEIIAVNKSEYIDLPDTPVPKLQSWTQDEVACFWEDYKINAFTGYILIMCYAGLRYGELATIELDKIFLDESYMIGGIKTRAGINREIPLSDKIRPVVEHLMIGRRKKLLEMNEDNFYEAYWEVIHRLGVHEYPPQTCRHFYFSSLTAAGVQGGIIAKVGGHSSYSTTMRNYVRIPLKDKIDAVNKI